MFIHYSIILSILISCILMFLVYFAGWGKEEGDKVFPLESGFSCIDNPLLNFSMQFYLLLIVFILFDLEIILMLGTVFFNKWMMKSFIVFLLFVLLTLFLEFFWGKLSWFNSTCGVLAFLIWS